MICAPDQSELTYFLKATPALCTTVKSGYPAAVDSIAEIADTSAYNRDTKDSNVPRALLVPDPKRVHGFVVEMDAPSMSGFFLEEPGIPILSRSVLLMQPHRTFSS